MCLFFFLFFFTKELYLDLMSPADLLSTQCQFNSLCRAMSGGPVSVGQYQLLSCFMSSLLTCELEYLVCVLVREFCSLFSYPALSSEEPLPDCSELALKPAPHPCLLVSSFLGRHPHCFCEKKSCCWGIGCRRKITFQLRKQHPHSRRMAVWFNEPGGRQWGWNNRPFSLQTGGLFLGLLASTGGPLIAFKNPISGKVTVNFNFWWQYVCLLVCVCVCVCVCVSVCLCVCVCWKRLYQSC
jgi:hypothetical protein